MFDVIEIDSDRMGCSNMLHKFTYLLTLLAPLVVQLLLKFAFAPARKKNKVIECMRRASTI